MSEDKPHIEAGNEADAHRRARALWLASEAARLTRKRARCAMNPTGLIPEAGMDAMTPQEWAHAINVLSVWIADASGRYEAMSGIEVLEHGLVVDLMRETLVDLICLPKAAPWLAWIEVNAASLFAEVKP